MRDSERCAERQDATRTLDRSQNYSLSVALRKPFVAESKFRYAKDGGQQANHRTKQSDSLLQGMNLCDQVGGIAGGSEIACDHIGETAVNPASNG